MLVNKLVIYRLRTYGLTLVIRLSFVGIHVSLLFFALLTYFQIEKGRASNLEASTSYKIRTASMFLKFDPFRI